MTPPADAVCEFCGSARSLMRATGEDGMTAEQQIDLWWVVITRQPDRSRGERKARAWRYVVMAPDADTAEALAVAEHGNAGERGKQTVTVELYGGPVAQASVTFEEPTK